MSINDYRGLITVGSNDIVDIVNTTVATASKVNASSLQNDVGYVTKDVKVANVTQAESAKTLTGTTGVAAGTYGPTSDATANGSSSPTINIPQITVNAQGLVTSVTNHALKVSTY